MIKALTKGPFTGRHITVIMVAFFAVVIGVNLIMARAASQTFGGVVVENSYVASQNFNGWLAEARREKALGWSAAMSRRGDNRIVVKLAGAPASDLALQGEARHPLGREADIALNFRRQADGSFVSDQTLPEGRWQVRLEARQGSTLWRDQQDLR